MNNTVLIQNIGITISAIVAIISLIISIQSYYLRKPKLKIEIADKRCDCFFGKTIPEESKTGHTMSISGAWVNLINNSPVSIKINSAYLQIKNERFALIRRDNSFWNIVTFYYSNEKGELDIDGGAIYYEEQGLGLPCKIEAYDTMGGVLLFHNFPSGIRGECKGTICIKTAIGVIKKRVRLIEYKYGSYDPVYNDFLQYSRSIEEQP